MRPGPMRLGLVAMLRNEADVAAAFLRHALALFDHAVLVDHRSADGTAEMLHAAARARPGWRVWRGEFVGHHHKHACGAGLRHLFEATDTDVAFLLDADEFLDVSDRAALEAAAAPLLERPNHLGRLLWRNCIPARLDQPALRPGDALWAAPERSAVSKIVVSRGLWRHLDGKVRPSTGNHAIEAASGQNLAHLEMGELLHVPLRSLAQMLRKVVLGELAALARGDRRPEDGAHRREMIARLAEGAPDEAELIGTAAVYSDPRRLPMPLAWEDLPAAGFTRRTLDVAAAPPDILPPPPAPPDPLLLAASILRDWGVEDRADRGLVLEGDTLRLPPPDPAAAQVAAWRAQFEGALAALQRPVGFATVSTKVDYRIALPVRVRMG